MSSVYSIGSMNQLADALEVAGFSPEHVTKLRQSGLRDILLVLQGLATIVREDFKLACEKPFSPEQFIGKGWTIWRGPVDGNGLEGQESRDVREDDLSVIDWEHVLMEDHLKEEETSVRGEEKLRRAIASDSIQLGGKAFLSLWEDYQANRENSVLEKLRLTGVTRIFFFGLVLRRPRGPRIVLCLDFRGSEWYWRCRWLSGPWHAADPSASLASKS